VKTIGVKSVEVNIFFIIKVLSSDNIEVIVLFFRRVKHYVKSIKNVIIAFCLTKHVLRARKKEKEKAR
jgi:hypothetical protein